MSKSLKLAQLIEHVVRKVVRSEIQALRSQIIMEMATMQHNQNHTVRSSNTNYSNTQLSENIDPTPDRSALISQLLSQTTPISARENAAYGSVADLVEGSNYKLSSDLDLPIQDQYADQPTQTPQVIQSGIDGKVINLQTTQSQKALDAMFNKDYSTLLQKVDQKAKQSRGVY